MANPSGAFPPKDLETLLVLVQRAGHIVEKDELLERVWPRVFIEEGNLSRHIFNLRQVLGDSPEGRKYIETIPRRGYRFRCCGSRGWRVDRALPSSSAGFRAGPDQGRDRPKEKPVVMVGGFDCGAGLDGSTDVEASLGAAEHFFP